MKQALPVDLSGGMQRPRIESVDLLRGLVMILMALDHIRDFMHAGTLQGVNPLDLTQTSPWLFFTRWITHYCAPIFIFLSGISIYFMSLRKSKGELSMFLFTRGLWLILAEITFIHIGWSGDFEYHFLVIAVIWVIGLSMVLLAALIHLPHKILLAFGLLLIFGHNLLDKYDAQLLEGSLGLLYAFLHVPHFVEVTEVNAYFIGYPLIPWLGVMSCGVVFGRLYAKDFPIKRRQSILVNLGLGSILLFLILRYFSIYGEAHEWSVQSTGLFTIMSFLNVTKYPPSLLYLLMTLGPAFLFLAFTENIRNRLTSIAIVFGRVPFFYYILHLYLIHALALIVFLLMGHDLSKLMHGEYIGGFPPGSGIHLWQIYPCWALVIFLLYFPCRWYNNYKSKHSSWWLSYL